MAAPDKDLQAAIAVTRFGLGARPGELRQARSDPQAYLAAQIRSVPLPEDRLPPSRAQALARFGEARAAALKASREHRADAQDLRGEVNELRRGLRDEILGDINARAALAASTADSFAERWALFWSNHFTVGAGNFTANGTIGPYEALAIRPHVFGPFRELLVSAETHPAMLIYLDQNRSIGPASPAARAAARRSEGRQTPGLNENLAREILELHTVGVDGGYTQADVTEFARALTGLSFEGFSQEGAGRPRFLAARHEPGAKTVMGATYSAAGPGQAEAILRDLAARPQTARFVSRKIARHFVADEPPPALCACLERAWLESDGALDQVALALISAPEAWNPEARKFKSPYEFVISAWRALDEAPQSPKALGVLTAMGQRPFAAPSPEGWPDETSAWATPDGLIKRLAWSQAIAPAAARQYDPNAVAEAALGARLGPRTRQAIAQAESRSEALTLFLMSPEFQWR